MAILCFFHLVPQRNSFLLLHCVPQRQIPSSDPAHMAWYALNSAGGHAWPRVAQAGRGHAEWKPNKIKAFQRQIETIQLEKSNMQVIS